MIPPVCFRRVLLCIATLAFIALHIACEGALTPENTPQRTVGNYLREAGLGNYDTAKEYFVTDAHSEVESWSIRLFFPDHSTPTSSEDETKLDKFIGNFYRITVMDSTETEASVNLTWVATDALIGFPSVADNPLVPNTTTWYMTLRREQASSDDEAQEYTDWKIVSIE